MPLSLSLIFSRREKKENENHKGNGETPLPSVELEKGEKKHEGESPVHFVKQEERERETGDRSWKTERKRSADFFLRNFGRGYRVFILLLIPVGYGDAVGGATTQRKSALLSDGLPRQQPGNRRCFFITIIVFAGLVSGDCGCEGKPA